MCTTDKTLFIIGLLVVLLIGCSLLPGSGETTDIDNGTITMQYGTYLNSGGCIDLQYRIVNNTDKPIDFIDFYINLTCTDISNTFELTSGAIIWDYIGPHGSLIKWITVQCGGYYYKSHSIQKVIVYYGDGSQYVWE